MEPQGAAVLICLALAAAAFGQPLLSPARIVNAASHRGGSVVPGEIVVLYPSGAGPSALAGQHLDSNGRVATELGETRVLFDGVPAPLAYAIAGEISAVVPYEVAHRQTTEIVVEYQGRRSPPVKLPVAPRAPALFTLHESGAGQAAMLNDTGCCNSTTHPAALGSVAALYATGEGQTAPSGITGAVSSYGKPAAYPSPQLPLAVTVGGIPAEIVYAGAAPHTVAGLLQVNFRVPPNAPVGQAVPIVLTVGKRAESGRCHHGHPLHCAAGSGARSRSFGPRMAQGDSR